MVHNRTLPQRTAKAIATSTGRVTTSHSNVAAAALAATPMLATTISQMRSLTVAPFVFH